MNPLILKYCLQQRIIYLMARQDLDPEEMNNRDFYQALLDYINKLEEKNGKR